MKRKGDDISLDDLDPFSMTGTAEDIAMVERGLDELARKQDALVRKQSVWTLLVQDWKRKLPSASAHEPDPEPEPDPAPASPSATVVYLSRQPESGLSINDLIDKYRSDERSKYHSLQHATRTNYDSLIKRIQATCGPKKKVSDLEPAVIRMLHADWSAGGATMGYALITMVRTLANFGASTLLDKDCRELAFNMHQMEFKAPKAQRAEKMTEDHAKAIIKKAHEMRLHSIALAQAFQWDLKLPQKDVIGEYVPNSEDVKPLWSDKDRKWIRGLHWSEINESLILRHATIQNQKPVAIDLKLAPMVKAELDLLGPLDGFDGPVIMSEETLAPYSAVQFRRLWRMVANAAAVPNKIKNMATRLDAEGDADGGDDESEDSQLEGLGAGLRR